MPAPLITRSLAVSRMNCCIRAKSDASGGAQRGTNAERSRGMAAAAAKRTRAHRIPGEGVPKRKGYFRSSQAGLVVHDHVLRNLAFLRVVKDILRSRPIQRRLASQPIQLVSYTSHAMELADVTKKLEQFASTKLAAEWDNAGLLLEPSPPHYVGKVLLTNDLTELVLDEAIETNSNLVVSYHPPLFSAVKKLRQSRPSDRIAVRCLENRIAVYSPHTAYDAVKGGVNDWLVSAFGTAKVSVLEQSYSSKEEYQVEIPYDGSIDLINAVESHALETTCAPGKLTARCPKSSLHHLASTLEHHNVLNRASVIRLEKLPLPEHGMGRLVTLAQPLQLSEVVRIVKKHLGITYVRLAVGKNSSEDTFVRTIAACAGSGGSLLRDTAADVLLTGEMSHHEILHAVNNNITVILCEHCNSERGFLVVLQQHLTSLLGDAVEVILSRKDRCPLVLA